jgi:hypothetical protein
VSALPVFVDHRPDYRDPRQRGAKPQIVRDSAPADESQSSFWHWFALAVLLFCWIAEASMCADRGF